MSKDLINIVLNTILGELPAHVYWKDTEGKYLGGNLAQAKQLGLDSTGELIGRTDFDFCESKLHAEELTATDRRIATKKKAELVEEIAYKQSGDLVYLSQKIPLLDTQDNVLGILGISFDITQQKNQQEFTNKLLQVLLDQFPGTVYWKDQGGKYLGCNKGQANLFGLDDPNTIIGKTDFDLPLASDPNVIVQNDKRIMNSKNIESFEESVLIKEKQFYFLSHKIPLMDGQGNVTGLLGISIDITDKKRAEALQKELEFQQRANTMLKLWSSAIAHEMRTPLTALSMNVSTLGTLILSLQNTIPEIKNSPRAMKKIERLKEIPPKLEKTIDHANHFIDMTLMKSRAGDEEIEMSLASLSMANEIKAALQSYPYRDGDEKFVQVDIESDFNFMGESNFFHHVIFNLLKNALHYVKQADKGGIFITTQSGKTENTLIFKDTGPGMSQENVDQLFKPFFSKTKHGTGVGLSLCHNLMGSFGGRITCESVEGEFTKFKLIFPCLK